MPQLALIQAQEARVAMPPGSAPSSTVTEAPARTNAADHARIALGLLRSDVGLRNPDRALLCP